MNTRDIQIALKRHGFDPGPIDGLMGPLTEAAIIEFKRSRGLRARAYVGPITMAALRDGIRPAPTGSITLPKDMPPWLRVAFGMIGLREIRGKVHNMKIVGMWEKLKLPFRDDETPWCAAFVNYCLLTSGYPITPKYRAAALGWRWTGYGHRLKGPALGAVMSVKRGAPGSGSGHQTFVMGKDNHGRIQGLGGNQGNTVSINPYDPWERDAQYHWPEGHTPIPPSSQIGLAHLPLVMSNGKVLTNEA